MEPTAQEMAILVGKKLKENKLVDPPEWTPFVKTGVHKERPPTEADWWYVRAGSVLRKISVIGPIGVNKLRRHYGGRKNRGHRPEHFYRGSGTITRKILQQLESAKLIAKADIAGHKGRVLTPQGEKLLASCRK